ncbi:hypothetical protein VTN02DRAFT_552 [Thermoascus thermophilus]
MVPKKTDADDDPPILAKRGFTYLHRHRLLILKRPTRDHERARQRFEHLMAVKLFDTMGLDDELDPTGAAPVEGTDLRTKGPDLSYVPAVRPAGRSDRWPSMVVEIGYAESSPRRQQQRQRQRQRQRQLERDIRWWLQESWGAVQLALSIQVKKRMHGIIIQKWELVPSQSDPQQRAAPVPGITQQVTISRTDSQPTTVTGGPLVLPFEKIFLRPLGASGAGAGADLVFREDELRRYAERVWGVGRR